MSDVLLPLGATLVAGALTYWCCVRPMLHGRASRPAAGTDGRGETSAKPGLDLQLAAARAELEQLRGGHGDREATAVAPKSPIAPARPRPRG